MLRTNLSTRPFYNDRIVKTMLGVLAAIALGLTVFNAVEIFRLRGQTSDAREIIATNDAQARDLKEKATAIRRSIDATRLLAVQAAAREANALIDRRTFSWTELLNQFQKTLPADVRIGGVAPQIDNDGRHLVQITVFSRRVEDLESFMAALEHTGAFSGVLPRFDSAEQDGTIRSELQAFYSPVETPAAGSVSPSSESGKTPPGNTSPGHTGDEVAPKPSAKAEPR